VQRNCVPNFEPIERQVERWRAQQLSTAVAIGVIKFPVTAFLPQPPIARWRAARCAFAQGEFISAAPDLVAHRDDRR
jgi:hypothetical protein